MRGIHPKSFGLGVASGVVVLLLIAGGMHLLQPRRGAFGGPMGGGTFQQGGGPNLARMAERFGMTEDELRKEMESGKTMQQIATEHGVDMSAGFGRGPRGGSGTMMQSSTAYTPTGSGGAMSVSSSAVTTSSSSSSSAAR